MELTRRSALWSASAVTIMDYDVPWDDFDTYDLIILSREGHEYVKFYRERDGEDPERQPVHRARRRIRSGDG
jgi:hypothetical protein